MHYIITYIVIIRLFILTSLLPTTTTSTTPTNSITYIKCNSNSNNKKTLPLFVIQLYEVEFSTTLIIGNLEEAIEIRQSKPKQQSMMVLSHSFTGISKS